MCYLLDNAGCIDTEFHDNNMVGSEVSCTLTQRNRLSHLRYILNTSYSGDSGSESPPGNVYIE
jgi:hypothetical protein